MNHQFLTRRKAILFGASRTINLIRCSTARLLYFHMNPPPVCPLLTRGNRGFTTRGNRTFDNIEISRIPVSACEREQIIWLAHPRANTTKSSRYGVIDRLANNLFMGVPNASSA